MICALFVLLTSAAFAQLEIQIEGNAGWARGLPTWRVENRWKCVSGWSGMVEGPVGVVLCGVGSV